MAKAKVYDPLDGVTTKSTKDELMERLRKAAAALRRQDRESKSQLQQIEDRIRAKGAVKPETLKQAIVSATEDEWVAAVEFLEEFDDLLPTALQRLVIGGQVLLGRVQGD